MSGLMFLQQDVEDQVELWWFGEPCISLLCYTSSVALVLGLGTGGVALLSSAGSAEVSSAVWRLTVGSALCILALVLVLKQLLSSAVQDMGCVRSRRRIVQLRSGGSIDPSLLLAIGLALMLGGATVLLCLASSHMLLTGTLLLSSGGAVVLSVVAYGAMKHVWERRERRRRRIHRRVRVYTVAGQRSHMWRDSASSQAGLI
ncbi:transmembrane protein 125 [Ictalurus punctatus]|uniref:Transmembrane protein 125 n=1 Tax=Ictalurus punctatus TaxID=7998 RepID=A0A2D0R8T4_ICTPU|nr:transmembrane protein 125 [Ictalurus punctatus]XP_053537605.1 transmembrane protein 125 [Ictalurus punctatus]